MVKYELKKVFSKRSSKIAMLLILLALGVTCYLAATLRVYYVDGHGVRKTGPSAVAALRAAQKEWSGYLDEEKICQVIRENNRILALPEYASDDPAVHEIAYSQRQGIEEIRNLLNHFYADGFRDYDYYRADRLTEPDAPKCYDNRIRLLEEWLSNEAKDQFSEAEKTYLVSQYEKLQTPLYVDYMLGWTQLFEYAPTIIMIMMLILGFLVSGIFSGEFSCRSDAVFFSCAYGRNRAVWAKIKAGFWVVTGIYFAVFLVYTGVLLLYLGADGWNLAIQADGGSWKSFYNISVWQEFLLVTAGGYVGCLFLSFLSMLVSAKTKSAVLAVMVPFTLIFLPSFLMNLESPFVNQIIGLLPDQLLQVGMVLKYFNLYEIGGKVTGALPVLMVLYPVLTAVIFPVIYREYSRKQME